MKLEKVELCKQEVKEKDGDFIVEKSEVENVPLVLTNRAINYAHQEGVIENSIISDLVSLSQMDENMDGLDDMQIMKTIYTAYIGGQFMLGKNKPKYSKEQFLDRLHIGTMEQMELYQQILVSKENKFVKDIERSTKKEPGKKKLDL